MTALRILLATLAVAALSVGIPAIVAPAAFFDDFPWLRSWVSLLPPYNEHLVTDVGGLQLAFGLLFAWAAVRPARELVVPVCVAWSTSQLLHLVFHVTHLDGFGVGDAVAQTASLLYVAAVPWLAVVLTRGRGGQR